MVNPASVELRGELMQEIHHTGTVLETNLNLAPEAHQMVPRMEGL